MPPLSMFQDKETQEKRMMQSNKAIPLRALKPILPNSLKKIQMQNGLQRIMRDTSDIKTM